MALATVLALTAGIPASAQERATREATSTGPSADVRRLLARGDSLHAARDAAGALRAYERALAIAPDHPGALWRAARDVIDVGEVAQGAAQDSLFTLGAEYAERAVAVDSLAVEAWFQQSRALGRVALTVSARERTQYAVGIHAAATRALELAPDHAGASHVLGRWHAEIMRLNGIARMIARRFLGGKVLGEANWDDALRLLERACELEPNRAVHLTALGEAYRDAGYDDKARTALEAAVRAPLTDPNDELYRTIARRALDDLR